MPAGLTKLQQAQCQLLAKLPVTSQAAVSPLGASWGEAAAWHLSLSHAGPLLSAKSLACHGQVVAEVR